MAWGPRPHTVAATRPSPAWRPSQGPLRAASLCLSQGFQAAAVPCVEALEHDEILVDRAVQLRSLHRGFNRLLDGAQAFFDVASLQAIDPCLDLRLHLRDGWTDLGVRRQLRLGLVEHPANPAGSV